MLERIARIEANLESLSDGLKVLQEKCLQAEKASKELKCALKKMYEYQYKVGGMCSENGTTYTSNS